MTSVKGVDTMLAWIGQVKAMAFRLTEIGVAITDEDQILVLTMGLDVSYEFFVISLDSTQPELLMLDYIIHHLLNEDVHCDNQEVGKVKDEIKPEKDKENVVLVVILSPGNPRTCWRCGKMGHIKAFCKEKPIRGSETREANVAFTTTDDSNIWLGDYEV